MSASHSGSTESESGCEVRSRTVSTDVALESESQHRIELPRNESLKSLRTMIRRCPIGGRVLSSRTRCAQPIPRRRNSATGSASALHCVVSPLVLYRLVGDLKTTVNNREGLTQLLFIDAQRRIRIERVPADQRVKPIFAEELTECRHFLRRAVEGRHGLPCLAAAN